MAIELCSDNNSTSNSSNGFSPRISFSHDLCLSDIVPIEHPHPLRSNSIGSIDFDFCTRKSFDQESSSADELFSDGKILPTEIKKKNTNVPTKQTENNSSLPLYDSSKQEKILKESRSATIDHEAAAAAAAEEKQSNSNSKSFWRFKRSSSLNCVSGYGRSLCPLPLLSRSNSTGSTPNTSTSSVKRVPLSKDYSNHKQQKQAFIKSQSSSSTSSSSSNYQKPPLKKNYGSYSTNGVRVNPVLNVPSGNLFGLGSIFFNGKDKNRKK